MPIEVKPSFGDTCQKFDFGGVVLCSAGCAKKIYKEGGMSALFKGNFATMIKVAPQTAIQFAVRTLIHLTMQRPFTLSILHPRTCSQSCSPCQPCLTAARPESHHTSQQSWFRFAEQSSHLTASGRMQVYDTITDAMYTSLARFEQASGIPQTRQLSKWQHLLAGD